MRARRIRLTALALVVGLVAAGAAVADPPDPDDPGLAPGERYAALVARAEARRAALTGLEARFVQRKESPLLLEPETSRGRFSFRAPDLVRWDYETPRELVLLVRDGRMVTWYPELARVERVELGPQGDRAAQLFGAGSSLADLEQYFTVRASFPAEPEAPYRLELTPRSKRIARRVSSLVLHLHRELYVPVHLRWEEPGGGLTEYEFEDLRIDPDFPEGRFELDLPEGIEEIELGFGG